jgi:hypothetical protein
MVAPETVGCYPTLFNTSLSATILFDVFYIKLLVVTKRLQLQIITVLIALITLEDGESKEQYTLS